MTNSPDSVHFELNIALIPDDELADKLIATSQQLAEHHPALVQLSNGHTRLALAPHLTLYQAAIPARNLDPLLEQFAPLSQQLAAPHGQATRYAFNASEASYEVQYAVTDELVAWQNEVISIANPLRDELFLERDPAGNTIAELLQSEGIFGENLRQTGYAEVGDPRQGGLFRPHATLNWFKLGTQVDENDRNLPAISNLEGSFPALGVYLLGPYGTCPQRLAQYALNNA